MKILLGPNGKPLLNTDRKLIEPCERYVASVTLTVSVKHPGSFSWAAGPIRALWQTAEWGDPDCIASVIPQPVSTVSGHLTAPCLFDRTGAPVTSPSSSFSVVAEGRYNSTVVRASATTPSSVTLSPSGTDSYTGSDTDTDLDYRNYQECSVAASSLRATATGNTSITAQQYLPGSKLDSYYTIDASSSVSIDLYSCGCCANKYATLQVSATGARGIAVVESSITISTKKYDGTTGKRITTTGSFEGTVLPGVLSWSQTASGGAAVILEWEG